MLSEHIGFKWEPSGPTTERCRAFVKTEHSVGVDRREFNQNPVAVKAMTEIHLKERLIMDLLGRDIRQLIAAFRYEVTRNVPPGNADEYARAQGVLALFRDLEQRLS